MPSNPPRNHPRPRPRMWLAASALALAANTAAAQSGTPLQALFEQAWQLQPEARALPLRRQAAQAQRSSADAWTPEPAALELESKTDRVGSRQGEREYTVGLALPLWLPGERARRAALGDAELQAVHSAAQAAQLQLAGRVRDAWWLWQRACGELTLAQDQEGSAKALEADVARRLAAGDMARSDHYQAQAGAAAAQEQAMARNAELARATRGFVAKAFSLGEADWPTRLRVEQDAQLAERQWQRARVDAAAATSTLRQALGLLPE